MTIFHIFANKETGQESYSLIEKIALPATRVEKFMAPLPEIYNFTGQISATRVEKFMAQLHHSAQPEKTNRISLNGF